MENSVEVLEFNTVEEAETEYLKRRAEGCWVMVDRLKVVWSWRKFKSVCRFSMKKVDKRPMDIVEFVDRLREEIPKLAETFGIISEAKQRRRQRLADAQVGEKCNQNNINGTLGQDLGDGNGILP
ncbi:MAG: hypothetical protein V4538_15090 [Bacteroidota bacterium]